MRISALFDPKKVLFLLPPHILFKLDKEVQILYVHSVGVLYVPFEGLDFSAPFNPLAAPISGSLISILFRA